MQLPALWEQGKYIGFTSYTIYLSIYLTIYPSVYLQRRDKLLPGCSCQLSGNRGRTFDSPHTLSIYLSIYLQRRDKLLPGCSCQLSGNRGSTYGSHVSLRSISLSRIQSSPQEMSSLSLTMKPRSSLRIFFCSHLRPQWHRKLFPRIINNI